MYEIKLTYLSNRAEVSNTADLIKVLQLQNLEIYNFKLYVWKKVKACHYNTEYLRLGRRQKLRHLQITNFLGTTNKNLLESYSLFSIADFPVSPKAVVFTDGYSEIIQTYQ